MSANQEEGWPLGLQPLNVRIVGRTMSFNTTMLTGSPSSSTDSSSDFDTQSTGSFFHDRSITLGSLLGVSNILELSRRSLRRGMSEPLRAKKPCKSRPCWIFSICSKDSIDIKNSTTTNTNTNTNTTPSLGQFLAGERRATHNNEPQRHQSPNAFVFDEISLAQPVPQPNSLFVNDEIAPPRSSPLPDSQDERGQSGVPVLLSCMCGQDTH